jgi:hypothetical protein
MQQSTEFRVVGRRSERIGTEGAEALRWRRCGEEVTKAGHCRRLSSRYWRRVVRIELGSSERRRFSDVLQSH